jgi:tetratricopeptide (TPR) repeat protein
MPVNRSYLASYCSTGYIPAQEAQKEGALRTGIDEVFMYRREDVLRSDLYKSHRHILDRVMGDGVFLWKPFVILDALSRIPNNAALVYCDCDMLPVASLNPLFEICERIGGVMLFKGAAQLCRQANKRDSFVFMNLDEEKYWNTPHVWAGFSIFIKNEYSVKFVSEWLELCKNEHLLLDKPNVYGKENLPEFCCHAPEEALLTLLAAREGLEIFRCPHYRTNYGKLPSFRIPGEPLGQKPDWPYNTPHTTYDDSEFQNSPYPNLIDDNPHPAKYGAQNLTLHQVMLHAIEYQKNGYYKDVASARMLYRKVLEIDPDNIDAMYLLGVCWLQLRVAEEAIPLFQKVIAKDVAYVLAHYCLAFAYDALGDGSSRDRCFVEVERLEPGFLNRHVNLDLSILEPPSFRKHSLTIYLRGVNYDEEFYLRRYPDVATAVSAGVFPSGFEHFRQYGFREGRLSQPKEPILPLLPQMSDEEIHRNVSTLRASAREALKVQNNILALSLLNVARALAPFAPEVIMEYGEALEQVGEYPSAYREYHRLCEISPGHPEASRKCAELAPRISRIS